MSYVDQVLAKLREKNANEPEFLQAAEEVLTSLKPVIEANEERFERDTILFIFSGFTLAIFLLA